MFFLLKSVDSLSSELKRKPHLLWRTPGPGQGHTSLETPLLRFLLFRNLQLSSKWTSSARDVFKCGNIKRRRPPPGQPIFVLYQSCLLHSLCKCLAPGLQLPCHLYLLATPCFAKVLLTSAHQRVSIYCKPWSLCNLQLAGGGYENAFASKQCGLEWNIKQRDVQESHILCKAAFINTFYITKAAGWNNGNIH